MNEKLRKKLAPLIPSEKKYSEEIAGHLIALYVDPGFVDVNSYHEVYLAPGGREEFLNGLLKILDGMYTNTYPLRIVVFRKERMISGKGSKTQFVLEVSLLRVRVWG